MKYSELLELDKAGLGKPPEVRPQAHQRPSSRPEAAKDTSVSRVGKQQRHRATVTPANHDVTVSTVEVIRKAVRRTGKEAATHRFTKAEKDQIAEIVYAYHRRGVRTSENEIARIAVNWLVQDYRANADDSILSRTMKALRE